MINGNPKVSIMISVYNQLHCLDKAIQSALDQNYQNLEIVIGDDFSTDGDVSSFINKYDSPQIKYFRNATNLGVSGNYRNLLYSYASGDLALMLNADDYLIDKEFISQAVRIFTTEPDIALVFGDVRVLLERTGEFISDSCNKSLPPIIAGNLFFIDYWKGFSLPHLACLYDRAHATSICLYASESISADLESLFRLVLNKKVGYINVPVGVLVRHQQNFTKSVNSFFENSATDFILLPFLYARENNLIELDSLEIWKKKMLKRYFLKTLVKLQFLAPDKISEYKTMVKEEHPEVFNKIEIDFRYKIFNLLTTSPRLLRFIFRRVFKQESFIADLIAQSS